MLHTQRPNTGRITRFWVKYRKSQYRGSTVWRWYFKDKASVDRWRNSHPNTKYYTELGYSDGA